VLFDRPRFVVLGGVFGPFDRLRVVRRLRRFVRRLGRFVRRLRFRLDRLGLRVARRFGVVDRSVVSGRRGRGRLLDGLHEPALRRAAGGPGADAVGRRLRRLGPRRLGSVAVVWSGAVAAGEPRGGPVGVVVGTGG